jgi:hypothetical protein
MITIFNGRSRGLGSQPAKDVYVQVSVGLRKHLHLFKGAKLNLFLAIALHSDTHGWSKPSSRTLRRETGLSPDTIFKTLAELCELEVEGHRVLLRKGVRRTGGQFASNNYLIFPTAEEVAKFETPYLFPSGPQNEAVSEKSDMAQTQEKEPLDSEPVQTNGRLATSGGVSLKSKFRLEDIRKYAWSCEGIRNPDGWSIAAQRSGEADELIEEFLDERARVRNDNPLPAPFETACHAVELAMSVNEISLAEAIARLREASSPTPGASSAEAALAWEKVLASIESKIQKESFETWFNYVRCEGIDGANRVVFLWTPNQVVRDWIRVNYSNLVDHALGETGLGGYTVEWVTAGEVHPAFQGSDEATVQRVINYFAKERGCKYELAEANAEVA